jgi:hypothetical protein
MRNCSNTWKYISLGFYLTNSTSFGELLFFQGLFQKTTNRDLIIKWIIGIPPWKIHHWTLEDPKRHPNEAERENLSEGARRCPHHAAQHPISMKRYGLLEPSSTASKDASRLSLKSVWSKGSCATHRTIYTEPTPPRGIRHLRSSHPEPETLVPQSFSIL